MMTDKLTKDYCSCGSVVGTSHYSGCREEYLLESIAIKDNEIKNLNLLIKLLVEIERPKYESNLEIPITAPTD